MLILRILQIFISWLIIASLVGIVMKKLRLPYTLGLVVVGLILAIIVPVFRTRPQAISPEDIRTLLVPNLILSLLIPPLVYEAALHLRIKELRQDIGKVLIFAIPGVVVTMLLVGTMAALGPMLTLPTALIFGALISATDPVAVIALFRSLGAPKRLVIMLEAESLFNDGTAIVLFHLMLGAVASSGISVIQGLLDFLRVAFGGVLVGGLVGGLISLLLKRTRDEFTEKTLSIIAAYGCYLLAEHFHLSGVLAVVAAGLICGGNGFLAIKETTREQLSHFWGYAAFLANTFVFLLIGLMIDLSAILQYPIYSLLAILAVLTARAVVIYGFSYFIRDIPRSFQHLLNWGGLRGAVSLALALSLTREQVGSSLDLLQGMAFSVVLFTLLIQGTTMTPLLKRLRLTELPPTVETGS